MALKKKIVGQRRHAKLRASQRHGLTLTTKDLKDIIAQIQESRSRPVERINNRLSVHAVLCHGKVINVVYDKRAGSVATVLPPP